MRSHLVATDSIRAIRLRGDRLLTGLSFVLWLVTLGLAPLYNTWLVWALSASSLVLIITVLSLCIPGTRGSRIGIGLALMGFPALTIYQSHGLVECHLGYFLLLGVLLYYRDWRPIFCSSTIVVAYYLVQGWLQTHGYPTFFLAANNGFTIPLIHVAYLSVETAILIFLTLTIRLEALESSAIAAFGERISNTGTLDLSFDADRHKGAAARGLSSLLAALHSITSQSVGLATRIDDVSDCIAKSSTRMLDFASAKREIVNVVSQTVQGMSDAGDRIKKECAAVAEVATHSANIVHGGCTTMQHTAELIQTVSDTASSTVTEIGHLQVESARIESIVGIMNDLSNQSSLLALNASIEAARAGDKGKGFQVVAQEIRTLSERSYQSLNEVQSIVDTIVVRVEQLHLQAQRCQSAVAEGGSQVRSAHAALTEVAQHLPIVAQRAVRAVQTADHHAGLSADVLSGMKRISESIVRTTQETQDIANFSQSLEHMSEELSANVQQFRTTPQMA